MKRMIVTAAAVLTLGAGSAFAASTKDLPNVASAQPVGPVSLEFSQSSASVAGPIYQRSVAAVPDETRHVIGNETFYYDPQIVPAGGDGAGGAGN
jgi:hypothetical protein